MSSVSSLSSSAVVKDSSSPARFLSSTGIRLTVCPGTKTGSFSSKSSPLLETPIFHTIPLTVWVVT